MMGAGISQTGVIGTIEEIFDGCLSVKFTLPDGREYDSICTGIGFVAEQDMKDYRSKVLELSDNGMDVWDAMVRINKEFKEFKKSEDEQEVG